MAAPLPVLLIPEIDADHERLEALLLAVATLDDAALERQFDAILAETAAHFAREEAFFAQAGARNLLCHRARHQAILDLGAALRESLRREVEPDRRRDLVLVDFARAIADHVFAMDRISAGQGAAAALLEA